MNGGAFPGASAMASPRPAYRPPPIDDLEPEYPAWLYRTDPETGRRVVRPPKKPTTAQWNSWVTSDEQVWGETVNRFDRDTAAFRGKQSQVFEDFDPAHDTPYESTEWAVQTTKLAFMIGTTPHKIRYRGRTTAEDTAAQDMEEADEWFLRVWAKAHASGGGGNLKVDMAMSAAQFGRIIVQCFCDPNDPDFPWSPALMDPRTCFPVFGDKHGLVRMTRVFTDSLGRALETFDPEGENRVLSKWKRSRKVDDNDLDLTQEVRVVDCANRWYRYVTIDGIVVLNEAHRYGRVPYVVRIGPGEWGSSSLAPGPNGRYTRQEVHRGWTGVDSQSSPSLELAHRGVAFMHYARPAIAIREAVGSLALTSLRIAVSPPLITTSPYPGPPSPVAMYARGHTKRRPGEVTTPVNPSPSPADFGAVMALNTREIANAVLPDMVFGNVEQSNVSGFASDTLIAAAKDRIQPYIDLSVDAIADVLECKNVLFRDHGHAYVGASGELAVPQRSRRVNSRTSQPMPSWATQIMNGDDIEALLAPGFASAQQITRGKPIQDDYPEIVLTRDMVKLVGARPEVTMVNIGLQSKTVLANYLKLLNDAKMISRNTAMEEIPEVDRSDSEWTRIKSEDAQTHPKMLELVEFPRSLWESGDVDGYLAYMATILMPALAQAMGPTPPPAGGGPTGAPPAGGDAMLTPGGAPPFPGSPGPQGPQAPIGASMAQLPGMAPGSGGAPVGRPS
jgi:hypothetical protein